MSTRRERGGGGLEREGFGDIGRERFFAEDVQAAFEGLAGELGVEMIGQEDENGFDAGSEEGVVVGEMPGGIAQAALGDFQ